MESLFEEKLRDKEIKLCIHQDPKLTTVKIIGNESLLIHSVFGNIVSNAIKFSPRGASLDFYISPSSGGWLEIRIRDHGIGIPKEIWHAFEKGGAIESRLGTQGEKGTGFGLAIARAYVEKMEGNLHLSSQTQEESPKDMGTEIRIQLRSSEHLAQAS
jgi:signal transduction histidine kinase